METLYFNLHILWLFISLSLIVRGIIEYKIFISFEDKPVDLISRITVIISLGLTNLIFFIFNQIKSN